MLYALIVSHIIMLGTFLIRLGTFPQQIPLFYSRVWGEFQLADWWMIFIIPLLMDALYFANLFIVRKFFPENEFVKKTFFYLNSCVIIVLTLIFMKIVFLIS